MTGLSVSAFIGCRGVLHFVQYRCLIGTFQMISENSVSQVERGVINPLMASLTRLAEALNTNLSSLFVGADTVGNVVRAGQRKRMAHPAGLPRGLSPHAGERQDEADHLLRHRRRRGEPYSHAANKECISPMAASMGSCRQRNVSTYAYIRLDLRPPSLRHARYGRCS